MSQAQPPNSEPLPPVTPTTTSFSSSSTKYKYTTSPPLAVEFGIPLERFAALHPEYHHFVVGAFIFSPQIGTTRSATSTSTSLAKESKWKNENITQSNPAVLILQRASSDSFSHRWDFPGGSVDFPSPAPSVASTSAAAAAAATTPATHTTATTTGTGAVGKDGVVVEGDETVLDAVTREVYEETGYHVKHIHALVHVNTWTKEKILRAIGGGFVGSDGTIMGGGLQIIVKYSFLVDVYDEDDEDTTQTGESAHWEDRVKLAPSEHQNYVWVTEADIERSLRWKAAKKGSGPLSALVRGVTGEDPKAIEEEGPVYDIIGDLAFTTFKSFETYRKVLRGD